MKHTWNRKIPDIVLERRILRLSSLQIKSKTMMSCSLRKKKRTHFLYRLFCPNFFFDICVLCQCIVYWTHSYNLCYIKKHYFIHFFACFQNPSKAFGGAKSLLFKDIKRNIKKRNFITLMIIIKIITMKIKVMIATKKILLVLIIRIMILRRTTITTIIIKIIT